MKTEHVFINHKQRQNTKTLSYNIHKLTHHTDFIQINQLPQRIAVILSLFISSPLFSNRHLVCSNSCTISCLRSLRHPGGSFMDTCSQQGQYL